MIHAGDVIANAVTGEELTFIKTARETNGEAVVLEARVRPNGAVAAAHFHPHQEERFQILEGIAGFRLGRKKVTAIAGDELVVPARTAHRFWNAGDEDLRFRAEVRPALQFEALIETMFNLANDGKTNRKGLPNPFRMAVIAHAYRDVIRLPFPPVLLQDMGLAFGVPMGRMLGYRPVYVPAAPAAELPAGT
jgi:mannose-6-phosphate isomerase-like protein (cupin superfamily)